MFRTNLAARRDRPGFTLVELTMVLAISGLLVIIVFYALRFGQQLRRDSRRKADLQLIAENVDKLKESTNNGGYYPWGTVKQGGAIQYAGFCGPSNVSCFEWFFDSSKGNSGSTFYGIANDKDPLSGTPYKYVGHSDGVTDESALTPPTSTTPATIYYHMGWPCGVSAGDGEGDPGFNSGIFRLTISLESGRSYCLDNH